jgi:pimeloyl-ACP methyl ester carboxylesterase
MKVWMSIGSFRTGNFGNGLPFVRVGEADPTLVILPGLADSAGNLNSRAGEIARQFQAMAQSFSVYVIGRRRGLPEQYSTRQMAGDYARVIENEIGPSNVLGISLGGYVAQYLAADSPELVRRLVIGCAAHRVGDEGRAIPERWLASIRQQRWREFYFDLARVVIQEYRSACYEFLIPMLSWRACDPKDFVVSLEACLTHDSTNVLTSIQAPTLVIGGTLDRFFPASLLCEMARNIPHASLKFIDGTGHGAHRVQKDDFESTVLKFLLEPVEQGSVEATLATRTGCP